MRAGTTVLGVTPWVNTLVATAHHRRVAATASGRWRWGRRWWGRRRWGRRWWGRRWWRRRRRCRTAIMNAYLTRSTTDANVRLGSRIRTVAEAARNGGIINICSLDASFSQVIIL